MPVPATMVDLHLGRDRVITDSREVGMFDKVVMLAGDVSAKHVHRLHAIV